jgi:hypothetical protein
MGKLSERKTRDTKPETNDRWLGDGDGDGLWLRIRSSGTRMQGSWMR